MHCNQWRHSLLIGVDKVQGPQGSRGPEQFCRLKKHTHKTTSTLCLRKKTSPFYFCDNFLKCRPILLNFGWNIPEGIDYLLAKNQLCFCQPRTSLRAAHCTCDTVALLVHATPHFISQDCGHWIVPAWIQWTVGSGVSCRSVAIPHADTRCWRSEPAPDCCMIRSAAAFDQRGNWAVACGCAPVWQLMDDTSNIWLDNMNSFFVLQVMFLDSYLMWQLDFHVETGDFMFDAVLYAVKIVASFYKV